MQPTEGTAIPDSPYAVQLREGFRGLRFALELEADFREEYAAQHMTRMRTGFWVAILMYLLFMAARLQVEEGPAAGWGLGLRLLIVSGLLVTLAVSYSRWRRQLPLFTVLCYALFGAAVTGIEVTAHRYGVDRHYEGLILVSIHCYAFSGLMLRLAMLSGAIIVGSYVFGGWLGGLWGPSFGYEVLFIVLTNVIAAAALYSTEYVERENFLRRRLLHEMVARDGLTGIHNRTAFLYHLERVLRQARREQKVLGLMMLDIDWFKPYNDRYGHVEGDACLRRVAQEIRVEFKRGFDMTARYGGEEFIGVWYDVHPEAVEAIVRTVQDRVQSLGIVHEGSPLGFVTVSVGAIAFTPNTDDMPLDLIRRADAALYVAKARGRNAIVTQVLPSALAGRPPLRVATS